MQDKIPDAKVVLTGVIAAGTAIWGWFGWLVLVWVVCMVLDYLSGSAAAMKKGDWSSPKAREGIWHKAGIILAVVVAGLGDVVLGLILNAGFVQLPFTYSVLLCPVVIAWYTLTELGSIAENAVEMGAVVPKWLRRILKVSADAVDKAGNAIAGEEETEEEKDKAESAADVEEAQRHDEG